MVRAESVLLSQLLKKSVQEGSWLGRFVTTQTKDCSHPITCPNYRKETICCLYKRSNEEHYHQNQGNNGTSSQAVDEEMSPWHPMYPLEHPFGEFKQPFHPANMMRRSLDIEMSNLVKKDVPKSSEISSDDSGFYKFVDSSGEVTYVDKNHENIRNVSSEDSHSSSESYTQSSSSSYDDYSSSSSSSDSSSGSDGGGSSYD